MRPIRSALNRIHHPAILAAGLVLAVAIPVEMGVYSSQNLLSWSTIRISLLVAVLGAMPDCLASVPVDLTPVDVCARELVALREGGGRTA